MSSRVVQEPNSTAAQREDTVNRSLSLTMETIDHIREHTDENCCCRKLRGISD